MAISIVSYPQAFTPAYNDQYFTCTSDNVGETGFSFIFDIYIDSALVTRSRIRPRPSDQYGIFNAKRIIESYVSNDPFNDIDSDFITHDNSYVNYVVKIGEEYDVAGVPTIDPDLYTSSATYAINASLDFLSFINWDYTDYELANSSKLFLTNSGTVNTALGERRYLYTLNNTTADYAKRIIKTYNSAGVLQNTFTKTNTLTASTDDNKFIRTACGPYHVLQQHGGTALDNISYYTVEVQTSGNTQISEAKRFNIVDLCEKYTHVKIHFLNKLGGFDSFTFIKANNKDYDIKRTTYSKGQTETISSKDRFKTVSNVQISEKIVVNSDWVSETEHAWLLELVTSPVIFHEVDNEFIAINCTETKYTEKLTVNDKLFNLRLEFEYTFINERQRY
jgi:hypothetical protein